MTLALGKQISNYSWRKNKYDSMSERFFKKKKDIILILKSQIIPMRKNSCRRYAKHRLIPWREKKKKQTNKEIKLKGQRSTKDS